MNAVVNTKRWPQRLAAPVDPMDTVSRSWWQSRYGLRQAPQLTDLRALARTIRGTYP